jgi:hypothetical protein
MMDLIQTLVKHFHIGKGEREEEFGKGSKKENWESRSYMRKSTRNPRVFTSRDYMKYRSLGKNMPYNPCIPGAT